MCHLNLCVKKWGSPSSFRRKRPFISLNNSAFIENLSSSEGARARARANHAKNNAQRGCVMQLNGITLNTVFLRFFISPQKFQCIEPSLMLNLIKVLVSRVGSANVAHTSANSSYGLYFHTCNTLKHLSAFKIPADCSRTPV